MLQDSVVLFFDDYDSDTTHPESFKKWLEEGANPNVWKTPKLREDLDRLKTGRAIISPVNGSQINPQKFVIFDAPLGYAHAETGELIDLMVFIDTPLDVAMARRVLRDLVPSSDNSAEMINSLRSSMKGYLDYGRQAYLEMDKQIKPKCDLIVDGCGSVEDIAKEIVQIIEESASVKRA